MEAVAVDAAHLGQQGLGWSVSVPQSDNSTNEYQLWAPAPSSTDANGLVSRAREQWSVWWSRKGGKDTGFRWADSAAAAVALFTPADESHSAGEALVAASSAT